MGIQFTDQAVSKGVSLPGDMWAYLERRREQEGVPVSLQIRRALEHDIMARASRRAAALAVPAGMKLDAVANDS